MEAMDYFRLGNDRVGYSEAYGFYRREVVADYFGYLVLGIFLCLLAVYLCVRYEVYSRLDRMLMDEEDQDIGYRTGVQTDIQV